MPGESETLHGVTGTRFPSRGHCVQQEGKIWDPAGVPVLTGEPGGTEEQPPEAASGERSTDVPSEMLGRGGCTQTAQRPRESRQGRGGLLGGEEGRGELVLAGGTREEGGWERSADSGRRT